MIPAAMKLAFLGSTLDIGGGSWLIVHSIRWTANANTSNPVDAKQRLQELAQSLESVGLIANTFG